MQWQDLHFNLSALEHLDWKAPHDWPLALRLSSLCLAALLAFLCAWILDDSTAELQQAQRELQQVQRSREAVELVTSRVRDLGQRSEILAGRAQQLSQGFLLSDELPDLLDLIATLSAEHLVILESLEVQTPLLGQHEHMIDVQPLSIGLRGTYHHIGALHQALASLPWPLVIDALEVRGEHEAGRSLSVQVRLLAPVWSLPARAS